MTQSYALDHWRVNALFGLSSQAAAYPVSLLRRPLSVREESIRDASVSVPEEGDRAEM